MAFCPQFVFLATGSREVARFPAIDADLTTVESLAAAEIADWVRLWDAANARWNATLIQNNFEISAARPLGHYSLRHPARTTTISAGSTGF